MTITTHEQPPRLWRGKHETLNLLMARWRVLSGFFFLSLALAVSKMLKGKKKKKKYITSSNERLLYARIDKVITNSLIKIYFKKYIQWNPV